MNAFVHIGRGRSGRRGIALKARSWAGCLRSSLLPPMLLIAGCAMQQPVAVSGNKASAQASPAPVQAAAVASPASAPSVVATAASAAPLAPPAPPPLPPIMPFDEALLFAANNLFKAAPASSDATTQLLVIDPLIDGNSGARSVATQTMEKRIGELVRTSYPRFALQPFNTSTLARAPLLFIGTFTAVDKEGKNVGDREWYRICLALLDVRTGKIVAKGFARSKPDGVDITPTAFFADSPAWSPDQPTEGYVKTCQGTKAGDPINAAYWDKIFAAAMVNDAIGAYEAGRYEEALDLYRGVSRLPGGDQLRVYNGMYLSAWKLGRQDDAAQAFARVVDYGIAHKRLGLKLLFKPGSIFFINDPQLAAPYPLWLQQLGDRAGERQACMAITGHTSRTGAEPVNERLSAMRAQTVQQRLEMVSPRLKGHVQALGVGSRENIVGLGTDDARDALDRRVEFKVIECVAG